MRLRATLAVGGAVVLLATGCQAPAPSVTVFSGSSSDHREAVCWTSDATQVDLKQCLSVDKGDADRRAELQAGLGSVPVRSEATIGVSVDREVADRGWYVTLGTNRVNVEPIRDTYYRLSLPAAVVERGDPVPLYVLSVDGADTKVTTGVWTFELVPDSGA
jgi:hypothetical protein